MYVNPFENVSVLHASSVARGRDAILLLGRARSGKSTACCQLSADNFEFISDSNSCLRLNKDKVELLFQPVEQCSKFRLTGSDSYVSDIKQAKVYTLISKRVREQLAKYEAELSLRYLPVRKTELVDEEYRIPRIVLLPCVCDIPQVNYRKVTLREAWPVLMENILPIQISPNFPLGGQSGSGSVKLTLATRVQLLELASWVQRAGNQNALISMVRELNFRTASLLLEQAVFYRIDLGHDIRPLGKIVEKMLYSRSKET